LGRHDHPWDYGICHTNTNREPVVWWTEVHSANSAHVDEVLTKLRWLRGYLDSAPALKAFKARYVWLATGSVYIRPGTPQALKLAKNGVRVVGTTLNLD